VGPLIAHLPELPKVCWRKKVSGSWVPIWTHTLISHFGRKHHGAMGEGGGGEDFEITTYAPEHVPADPQNPVVCFEVVRTSS